jgi:predicted short-subunit dehydrogenase-like oxidoreductase (DUF2520 family)
MSRPARLAVGVISAGRVGAVLGAALARAGHSVRSVSGLSRQSLARAAELLPGADVRPPDEVADGADLVLLAIPDDALAGTVRGLAAAGALRSGQIVAHTSGASGVDVLAPATEAGALPLALHPAMTFTGRTEDLERLGSCCFGVTATDGDEAAWHVAEALVMEMAAEPVRVPEAARPVYHAALVHGANHLMTLVTECADLLSVAGVPAAERLMAPLLSASLDNALRYGDRALSGPVSRGDVETVRANLAAIAEHAPASAPAYRVLARRTLARARDSGLLTGQQADDLAELLEQR